MDLISTLRRIVSWVWRARVDVVLVVSALLLLLGVGVAFRSGADGDSPIVPTRRIDVDVDRILPEPGVPRRDGQGLTVSRYGENVFRSKSQGSGSGSQDRIPSWRPEPAGPFPQAPDAQPQAQPEPNEQAQPEPGANPTKLQRVVQFVRGFYAKGKDATEGTVRRVKRLVYLRDQGLRLCNLALDALDPVCEDIVDFDTRLILSDRPEHLPGELNRPLFRYLDVGNDRIYALNLQRVYQFNNRAVVVGTLDLTNLTRKSPIVRASNVATLSGYDGVDLYVGYNVRFFPELDVGIMTRVGNATAPVGSWLRTVRARILLRPADPVSYGKMTSTAGRDGELPLERVLPLGVRVVVEPQQRFTLPFAIPENLSPRR